jgi:hypothetical protein
MKINIKKKEPKKPFDVDREKRIVFDPGAFSLAEHEREYYIGYPYRYWFHKARALWHFIEDTSKLSYLRTPNDTDSDDYIIENLKMEIHMIVFHSAESLFLTTLGHYFYPAAPWLWMSACDQKKSLIIMEFWEAKGLDAIIKQPQEAEEWLRETLYPTVIESDKHYQKAKESAAFIKKFLDRLVTYYIKHNEYNAYKHGLRLFPGQESLTVIDDTTQKVVSHSQGDMFVFLNHKPLEGTLNGQPVYGRRIKRNSKRYDSGLDIKRINVITGILQNFLEEKHVQFKTPVLQKRTSYRAYFDDYKVEDFFSSGDDYSEMSV